MTERAANPITKRQRIKRARKVWSETGDALMALKDGDLSPALDMEIGEALFDMAVFFKVRAILSGATPDVKIEKEALAHLRTAQRWAREDR